MGRDGANQSLSYSNSHRISSSSPPTHKRSASRGALVVYCRHGRGQKGHDESSGIEAAVGARDERHATGFSFQFSLARISHHGGIRRWMAIYHRLQKHGLVSRLSAIHCREQMVPSCARARWDVGQKEDRRRHGWWARHHGGRQSWRI